MGKERNEYLKTLPKQLTYDPAKSVRVGKINIGDNHPVFIIAEVGANHRGDIKNVLRLIDKAKEAGADAVKFQHLTHNKIAAPVEVFHNWNGKPVGKLSEFYKPAEMPYEWTAELINYCKKKKIMFLSTPFDKKAVDVLDKSGVEAFKVASYELTDDILLSYIAKKGKPVIISTGMADLEEITHAIKVIIGENNQKIIILHCSSMYPPKFEYLNLKAITALKEAFKLPIGYSDHTEPGSLAAPIAAVTLGACIIEKHITDDQEGGSNDDVNSVNVEQFKKFVQEIRNAELALKGSGIKQPIVIADHEKDEIAERWTRRTLYAARDLRAGETIDENKVITLRPWGGIAPKDFPLYRGKKLKKSVKQNEPLKDEHFTS